MCYSHLNVIDRAVRGRLPEQVSSVSPITVSGDSFRDPFPRHVCLIQQSLTYMHILWDPLASGRAAHIHDRLQSCLVYISSVLTLQANSAARFVASGSTSAASSNCL